MMPASRPSDQVAVILHRPSVPENVGAVARVMRNTGFSRLILSSPEIRDWDKARKVAVSAADLVTGAPCTDSLTEAISLADARFVAGTTGRSRRYWKPVDVAAAAPFILTRSEDAGVALVFGPEDRGLTNEELTLCHLRISLPAVDLASYNLSHAVAIVLFTVMSRSHPQVETLTPTPAPFYETEGMYAHVQELLTEIEFLWEHNPQHMMRAVRDLLNRAAPTEQEVRMVRGVCRRLLWHLRNGSERGGKES